MLMILDFSEQKDIRKLQILSFQLKFMWTIPSGFCLPFHIKPQDRQMVILPDSLDVGSALSEKSNKVSSILL